MRVPRPSSMYRLAVEASGYIYLTTPDWLTLHGPLTVSGSPAFQKAVPRPAVLRMVSDYHRGVWGRAAAEDKARHAGRRGHLTRCYTHAGVRVHVITDHHWTWFVLADE